MVADGVVVGIVDTGDDCGVVGDGACVHDIVGMNGVDRLL